MARKGDNSALFLGCTAPPPSTEEDGMLATGQTVLLKGTSAPWNVCVTLKGSELSLIMTTAG